MRKYIYIFLVIFLYSCNNNQGGNFNIPLFNQYAFEVRPDEKQVSLNQQIQDEYLRNLENTDLQIPLFRVLRGKDYLLFIGIPYGLKSEFLSDSKNFNKTDNSSYPNSFYRKCKVGNRNVLQVITKPDNNWISILVVVQNENDDIDFDSDQLLKRIIKTEK